MQTINALKEKIRNSKDMFPNPTIGELKKKSTMNYLSLKVSLEDIKLNEHQQIPLKIIVNLSALNIRQAKFNFKLLNYLGHKFKDNLSEFSLPTHVNFIFLSAKQVLNQFVVLLKSSQDISSVVQAVHQCLFFKLKLTILLLDSDKNNQQKQEGVRKLHHFLQRIRAYGIQVVRWKRQPSQIGKFLKCFSQNVFKKMGIIEEAPRLKYVKLQNISDFFFEYYRKNLHIFVFSRLGKCYGLKKKVISKLKLQFQNFQQFEEQVREIKQKKNQKNRLTEILCRSEDQIVLKSLVEFFHAQVCYELIRQKEMEGIKQEVYRKQIGTKYEEQRKQEDERKQIRLNKDVGKKKKQDNL